VKAVNTENLLVPAGDVKIGDFDYNVYSNSIVSLVKDMNDFPIKVTNGIPVFLKEVGTAADSTAVQVNVVRANGRRSVYVPILKQAGANTLKVIDGIRDTLPKLKGIPSDLELKLIFDQSSYIRQSISTVQHEMLLGGGLACLMILIFLGSFRAMLIIALAIPICPAGSRRRLCHGRFLCRFVDGRAGRNRRFAPGSGGCAGEGATDETLGDDYGSLEELKSVRARGRQVRGISPLGSGTQAPH